MKRRKEITHTLYKDAESYGDGYSCAWSEGQHWARFSSDEFQFTISRDGVRILKELVDAFLEAGGESDE